MSAHLPVESQSDGATQSMTDVHCVRQDPLLSHRYGVQSCVVPSGFLVVCSPSHVARIDGTQLPELSQMRPSELHETRRGADDVRRPHGIFDGRRTLCGQTGGTKLPHEPVDLLRIATGDAEALHRSYTSDGTATLSGRLDVRRFLEHLKSRRTRDRSRYASHACVTARPKRSV